MSLTKNPLKMKKRLSKIFPQKQSLRKEKAHQSLKKLSQNKLSKKKLSKQNRTKNALKKKKLSKIFPQ